MAPDVSPVLGHEILDLVAKRTSLMVHLDRLRTLVVGSSHGDFGFDPAYVPEAFNLCSASQDLLHSTLLVEKMSRLNPTIANIVVFYSTFSPGHVLEKTSDKLKCAALKEVFCWTANTPIPRCWQRMRRSRDDWPGCGSNAACAASSARMPAPFSMTTMGSTAAPPAT